MHKSLRAHVGNVRRLACQGAQRVREDSPSLIMSLPQSSSRIATPCRWQSSRTPRSSRLEYEYPVGSCNLGMSYASEGRVESVRSHASRSMPPNGSRWSPTSSLPRLSNNSFA